MKRMTLRNIGQIKEADLRFGDLTVLVGPQASGKSISLQWLKLLLDTGLIQEQLHTYGLDYGGKTQDFLDLYLGEGMRSVWRENSEVLVDGKALDIGKRLARKQKSKTESMFLIPAKLLIN